MIKAKLDHKINQLEIALKDAGYFLEEAKTIVSGDVDGKDLQTARDELANASNVIDDAMGVIDELLAPEPTREDYPDIP